MQSDDQLSISDIFADIPATLLPSGWSWKRNIDGTGYLLSPYGRSLFCYDLKPSRYGEGICFCDSSNNDSDENFFGSFESFRLFIEGKTQAWLSRNKEIEFVEISPDLANRIFCNPGGHSLPYGLFFVKEKGKYVGIDNSFMFTWSEEFADFDSCAAWLRCKHDISDYLKTLAKEISNQDPTT